MSKVNNYNIQQGQNKMPQKNIKFEVNPLDVNIAKMQYNLLSRCSMEVPENGDFVPIVETFKNKNPGLNLSEIKIICKYDNLNPGIKNSNRILSAIIGKANAQDTELELFKGTKSQLLDYLKTKDLFEVCKGNAIK